MQVLIPFQSCNITYQVVLGSECAGLTNDSVSTVTVTVQCGVDTAQRVMEKAADANSSYVFSLAYTGQSNAGYVVEKLFGYYAPNGTCNWYVFKNDMLALGNFFNRTVSTFIVNQGQVVLLRYGVYKAPTLPPTTAATTVATPGNAALSSHDCMFAYLSLFAAILAWFLQ